MKKESWDAERDGPLSEAALREKIEGFGYQVSRYVYPPGTYFPPHTHGIDKIDAVLSGQFRLLLEGREVILEAGDWVAVPRGAEHIADVMGDAPVVSLDATKRFA